LSKGAGRFGLTTVAFATSGATTLIFNLVLVRVLSAAEYGSVARAFALGMAVAQLTMAGIAPAIARWVAQGADDESRFSRARGGALSVCLAALVVSSVYFPLAWTGLAPTTTLSLLLGWALALIYASYFGLKLLLFVAGLSTRYAVLELASDAALFVALALLAVLLPRAALLAFALAYGLFIAMAVRVLSRRGHSVARIPLDRRLAGYAGWASLATYASIGRFSVVVVVTGAIAGSPTAGRLTALLAIIMPFFLVPQVAATLTFADVARAGKDGAIRQIQTMCRVAGWVSAFAAVTFCLLANDVVHVLLGANSGGLTVSFVILVLAVTPQMLASPIGGALAAEGSVALTARASIAAFALMVVALGVLVPAYGLLGATIAFGVSMMASGLWAITIARKRFALGPRELAGTAVAITLGAVAILFKDAPFAARAASETVIVGLAGVGLLLIKGRGGARAGSREPDAPSSRTARRWSFGFGARPVPPRTNGANGRGAHKIALTHMSRDSNRGDFAILAATYHALVRCDPTAEVTAISVELGNLGVDDPAHTGLTRRLGCAVAGTPAPPRGYFRGRTWRWCARLVWCELVLLSSHVSGLRAFRLMPRDCEPFLRAIREADIVIAKGGSYIHAAGGMRELLFLWRMLYPLRVAKRLGSRPVLLGVSVGEFRSKGSRWLARRVLRDGVVMYVREPRSIEVACRELKRRREHTPIIPDLAFLLEPNVGKQHPDEWRERRQIGVTVRAHTHPRCDREAGLRNYVESLSQALRTILDRDHDLYVKFIPQVSEDEALAREVAARVSRSDRVEVLGGEVDIDALLAMYGSLEILVGSRLHSVILAALVGVPAVHVIYEPSKSYGTLDLLGMTEFGISYEDLDSERLTVAIERLRRERTETHSRITQRVDELRSEVRATVLSGWDKWACQR